jgi:hypothetical protein
MLHDPPYGVYELKKQPTIHSQPKIDTLNLQMYCGLRFLFRRAIITREIPCICYANLFLL